MNATEADKARRRRREEVRKRIAAALKKLWPLLVIPAIGVAAILIYGAGSWRSGFASVIGVGLMTGAAALATGAFLGFLFGIPRALQRAEPNLNHGQDDAEPQRLPEYRINTNLEQISDWLTKILVGVGLTQLPAIGEAAGRLVNEVGDGLGSGPGSIVFAGAILVYFLVSGFLGGYVLTRTILTETFTQFDKIVSEKEEVEERNKELTREVQALHLVDRLLADGAHAIAGMDGHGRYRAVARQLTEAMRGVGSDILRLIFAQAQQVRSDNWRRNPVKMARVIPVFQALIEVDPDNQYYRNHGELGFALKDKEPPDYAGAKEHLDEAIRIRNRVGDLDDPYFRLYEFSRALCQIALDPSKSENPTTDPLKQEILDDLRAAASVDFLWFRIERDGSIKQWLQRNHMDLDDLREAAQGQVVYE